MLAKHTTVVIEIEQPLSAFDQSHEFQKIGRSPGLASP